jgi:hypothetical protein
VRGIEGIVAQRQVNVLVSRCRAFVAGERAFVAHSSDAEKERGFGGGAPCDLLRKCRQGLLGTYHFLLKVCISVSTT